MNRKIGFMQGRLSDQVEGKIQAFPWQSWETEFPVAATLDLHLVEWTLDQDRLSKNPLMTEDGQKRIRELCHKFNISVPSLTGDCFMQAPFWKVSGKVRTQLQEDFLAIARAAAAVGIRLIIVPLVDNGRLETIEQENVVVNYFCSVQNVLEECNVQVIFESDYMPSNLRRFMARLPVRNFGVNYDIGNSAAFGFAPAEEIAAYGARIVNVHVKDRVLGGTTVPLSEGNADFNTVFCALAQHKYQGNFILQTARAQNGNHADALRRYRDMTHTWMHQSGLIAESQ